MAYYGDFIGFQFGEHHFPDKENGFMLYRVSDGSRYTDPSVAQFQDTQTKIPGGDGTYYWDSFYTQRAITVQCAFDNLTEAHIRKIRQIFNGKAEDWLVFDETPFKRYRVKMQSPPQLKYIAFNEGEGRERIYKGELTLNFISYTPYAINTFKYLSEVVDAGASTDIGEDTTEATPIGRYYWYEGGALNFSKYEASKKEWLPSVGLLDEPITQNGSNNEYYIYNPGDIPTDHQITLNIADAIAAGTSLQIDLLEPYGAEASPSYEVFNKMTLSNVTKIDDNDFYIQIDSATNLIYGLGANKDKTGSLYNKFLVNGNFFKLPVSTMTVVPSSPNVGTCYAVSVYSGAAQSSLIQGYQIVSVDYDYLFH